MPTPFTAIIEQFSSTRSNSIILNFPNMVTIYLLQILPTSLNNLIPYSILKGRLLNIRKLLCPLLCYGIKMRIYPGIVRQAYPIKKR